MPSNPQRVEQKEKKKMIIVIAQRPAQPAAPAVA